MLIMSILAVILSLMAMTKFYRGEKQGRADHVFGRTVSGIRLMMGEGLSFGTVYGADIVYHSAILVLLFIVLTVIGMVGYKRRDMKFIQYPKSTLNFQGAFW